MRIKTMAVLITEETYPMAVACLPAGFSSYSFHNVKNYWLVINVPGMYYGDEDAQGVGFVNIWIHPDKFAEQFSAINKKPGRTAEGAWVEVEKALDIEMKKQLEEIPEEQELFDSRRPYRPKMRRHIAGNRG